MLVGYEKLSIDQFGKKKKHWVVIFFHFFFLPPTTTITKLVPVLVWIAYLSLSYPRDRHPVSRRWYTPFAWFLFSLFLFLLINLCI